MTTYDVLIIGGGPAGLSAATALVRQLHSIVVFDSGKYRNELSKHMHNVPAWDDQDPAAFRSASRQDLLKKYENVKFEETEITEMKQVEGGFEATSKDGQKWKGRKVILASGVEDIFPEIEGYAECWARRIYHCLFCHGVEARHDGAAGVLAVGFVTSVPHALQLARNATQLCGSATIYTDGDEKLASDLKAADAEKSGEITIDTRKIARLALQSGEKAIEVEFQDGKKDTRAFLAHAPMTRPRGPFVEQLGLETSGPFNDVKVAQPFLQTSVRGVFAAGDNMVMAKAVPNAIANGAMAAVSASSQIQAEKHGHKAMF